MSATNNNTVRLYTSRTETKLRSQLSASEMPSSWLLALLSLSAADGLRGGAMAGGPLLKSGAQSQRSEPVTPRAVVVLRGGGARRLRTHSTALSLSLSLHPRYA